MRVVNETAMTYEHLMEFSRNHRRKLLLILYIMEGTYLGLMLVGLITKIIRYVIYLGILPPAESIASSLCIIALLVVAMCIPSIRRRWICRKQADLHETVTYVFTQEGYEEMIISNIGNIHASFTYNNIKKVTESKNFFYLYVTSNGAHIVDKRGFTEGSEYDFRVLLHTVIPSKNLYIP